MFMVFPKYNKENCLKKEGTHNFCFEKQNRFGGESETKLVSSGPKEPVFFNSGEVGVWLVGLLVCLLED